MVRRLKREVAEQLPAKRRQVVRLPKPRLQDWPPDAKRPRPGADPAGPASSHPACLLLWEDMCRRPAARDGPG